MPCLQGEATSQARGGSRRTAGGKGAVVELHELRLLPDRTSHGCRRLGGMGGEQMGDAVSGDVWSTNPRVWDRKGASRGGGARSGRGARGSRGMAASR